MSFSYLDLNSRQHGVRKQTSFARYLTNFSLDLMEYGVSFRIIGLMNHLLILSCLIAVQGENPIADFCEEKLMLAYVPEC